MILTENNSKLTNDICAIIDKIDKFSILKSKIDAIVFEYNEQVFSSKILILSLGVGTIEYMVENNFGEAYIIKHQNLKLIRKAKIESLLY